MGQPRLQGGGAAIRLLDHMGDAADLCIHTRSHGHAQPPPRQHLGAAKSNVPGIAGRSCRKGKSAGLFEDGNRFPGQRRFIDREGLRLKQTQIGADPVARLEEHQVAGNNIRGGDKLLPPIPQHPGPRGGQFLQCFQGALRAVFLDQAQKGIEQHDYQYGQGI